MCNFLPKVIHIFYPSSPSLSSPSLPAQNCEIAVWIPSNSPDPPFPSRPEEVLTGETIVCLRRLLHVVCLLRIFFGLHIWI